MDIDQLVHMDDGEFDQCVSQAIKRRGDFPRWWAACLHADVIDDTEEVVTGFVETGMRQAQDPVKYPVCEGVRVEDAGCSRGDQAATDH